MGIPTRPAHLAINPRQPLARGLVFYYAGEFVDIVSQGQPQKAGTASNTSFLSTTKYGRGVETTETTHGPYWPRRAILDSVTQEMTIVTFTKIATMADWFKLLHARYGAQGTWSAPWLAWSLGRNANTSSGAFFYAVAAKAAYGVSDTGFLVAGETHAFGVTRRGTTVTFYRDGAQFGAVATATQAFGSGADPAGPIDHGGKHDVSVHFEDTAVVEGGTATCSFALAWNRVLSPREIAEISSDPYAPVRRSRCIAKVPLGQPYAMRRAGLPFSGRPLFGRGR